MATRYWNWILQVGALLVKDFRGEYRTRYALNSFIMFALTTLVVVSFATGPYRLDPVLHGALLWIILFFSAMAGLSRSFVKEEEKGTALALKMSAAPEVVFMGKFLFNFILLVFSQVIIVPFYFFFMDLGVGNPLLLIIVLGVGSLGLAGSTTILAAIVSRASVSGNLMPVLAFPILLPLLVTAINGTRLALEGGSLGEAAPELRVLVSFFAIMLTVSLLLFHYVWED